MLRAKALKNQVKRYFGAGGEHKPVDYKIPILTFSNIKAHNAAFGFHHEINENGLVYASQSQQKIKNDLSELDRQAKIIEDGSYSEIEWADPKTIRRLKRRIFLGFPVCVKIPYFYNSKPQSAIDEKNHGYFLPDDVGFDFYLIFSPSKKE